MYLIARMKRSRMYFVAYTVHESQDYSVICFEEYDTFTIHY